MEFIKAMKIRQRMCSRNKDCGLCPLSGTNNGRNTHCINLMSEYPEEAEKALEKWDKEHPVKTILDEFKEKYPDAPLNDDGTPKRICPAILGYKNLDYCSSCIKCWSQPAKEV